MNSVRPYVGQKLNIYLDKSNHLILTNFGYVNLFDIVHIVVVSDHQKSSPAMATGDEK